MSSQHRGHLAVAELEAGLQDHRLFQARQSRRVQKGFPGVRDPLLAVDGTRIKAVNNKDRNFTTGSLQKFIEAAEKKLEDYLKRVDAGDAEECATGGSRVKNLAEKIEALKKKRGEYAAYLSALEKSGESQVSLTDTDSRAMAAHTKVGVGYNIQIAVDAKHKMIVEQAVSN